MIERIDDAGKALEACGDLFRSDPVGANPVTITLYPGRAGALLRVVDDGQTLGVAARERHHYSLTSMVPGAAVEIADELGVDEPISVTGSPGDVASLAAAWSARCDGSVRVGQIVHRYRLVELDPGKKRKGAVRASTSVRSAQAISWWREFCEETGRDTDAGEATERVNSAINEGRLMEWVVVNEVVAQLIVSPARFGVVRIDGVHTPAPLRKHGWSGALVSAVAGTQIGRGKVDEVVLDTPASSGSTNRMYRRLGFEIVSQSLDVTLTPGRR